MGVPVRGAGRAAGAAHPPVSRVQPRQHQGEDVEGALSGGLLGDAAPLQQQGLGGAEAGVSGSPQPRRAGRDSPSVRTTSGHAGKRGDSGTRRRGDATGSCQGGAGFLLAGPRLLEQEPDRAPGTRRGATLQLLGTTPTAPPRLQRSGRGDGPAGDATVSVPAVDKPLPGAGDHPGSASSPATAARCRRWQQDPVPAELDPPALPSHQHPRKALAVRGANAGPSASSRGPSSGGAAMGQPGSPGVPPHPSSSPLLHQRSTCCTCSIHVQLNTSPYTHAYN